MNFECPGRTLATLGGIWASTLNRWVQEGMPPNLKEMPKMVEYFDLDPHIWTGPSAQLFVYPPFEHKIVRETDTKVTYVNHAGIVCTEFKKDAYKSMPHFESYPVKNRKDWTEYRKRLRWDPDRIGDKWEQQKRQWAERDTPLILYLDRLASLYGSLRDMVGTTQLSMLFYDDPELVEEMMDTVTELFEQLIPVLFADFVPDAVCMWEDMAFKNGPLVSPKLVRQFMLPRYRRMTEILRDIGVPIILLDSDGNVGELIPIWLEADIDGVVPMEVQAGMDVDRYRQKYPELLIMGGVDKKALAAGPDAIDAEMEKIECTIASGGYVPFFDHGLPHDVSYDNFLYFVQRLKETVRL